MKIWIDADACPVRVKEIIFKASERLKVPVTLVSNKTMSIPRSALVDFVLVDKSFDAADLYIVQEASNFDLVITADIPLAKALVDKGVLALNYRGQLYTPENVQEAFAIRNLMQELREGGIIRGGPAPFNNKDAEKFANAFDKELTRLLAKSARSLKT